VPYKQLLTINVPPKPYIIALLFLLFAGCQVFEKPQQTQSKGQLGDYLIAALKSAEIEKKQNISDIEQISAVLQKAYKNTSIPESTVKLLKKSPALSAQLIKFLSQGYDLEQFLIEQTNKNSSAQQTSILLGLKLFPTNRYRILEALALNVKIKNDDIVAAGLLANLELTFMFSATASQDEFIKVEPLFHSASITLINQQQSNSVQIQYKAIESDNWLDALPLQWEPIRGALSGSIVRLQSDTKYELYISLFNGGELIENIQQTFKTRSESPTINPDLVYKLSDIYTEGQLDLEALNIQGEEDGWAKIIGDADTIIQAFETDKQAINIGNNSYIYFENITVKGGRFNAIKSNKAHHLWFNGCNVSGWGRNANIVRNGKSYENESDTKPINYDAGFFLEKSGVIVIENCEVHSPNMGANNWGTGHPHGTTALLLLARHSNTDYQGQYVIRYNRFYGSDEKRFNDVIESRSNGRVWGGFIRDSAIHDNYLAYANDDIIELDGGQSNILFYNNEIEQGFCGISATPNMLGPSYIFNNYIHNLGDDRGVSWAAIKLGGLLSAPAGIVNIFENFIKTASNGITGARFANDKTFWVNAKNNILIQQKYNAGKMGFSILDTEKYYDSVFDNNFIFNTVIEEGLVDADITTPFDYTSYTKQQLSQYFLTKEQQANIQIKAKDKIPNFSLITESSSIINIPALTETRIRININFNETLISTFSNQYIYGDIDTEDNGKVLYPSGNNWQEIPFEYTTTKNTVMEFDVHSSGEQGLLGVLFENDDRVSYDRMMTFYGTQRTNKYEIEYAPNFEFQQILVEIGQKNVGDVIKLVFIHDRDRRLRNNEEMSWVKFKNVQIYEKFADSDEQNHSTQSITIGITTFDN
jgi:hypothetical protein